MKKNLFVIILALTLAILCGCTPAEVSVETTVVPETLPPETAPIDTEPQLEVLDPVTLSYDDYLTEIHGILPNAEGVTLEGSAIEVTEVKGVTYFHAKDLGKIIVVRQSHGIKLLKLRLGFDGIGFNRCGVGGKRFGVNRGFRRNLRRCASAKDGKGDG